MALFVGSIGNLKLLKHYTFSKKNQFFLLFVVSSKTKMEKYLDKNNQLRYQTLLVCLKIYNYFKKMVQENKSQ